MITPLPHDNRPGLSTIAYRVGGFGDFRQSMLARLADPSPAFAALNALRTRDADDPTIALIDAFAAVGEILTFYQERLANEGYLRTATEPRSLLELSRLTGYRLRPGAASSVALAFTLDPASSVTLPAGSRAQSVPGPGQTAQTFETSDDLAASGAYNAMSPRLTRPTLAATDLAAINVAGTTTGLKPNDMLLLVVGGQPVPRRVAAITPQFDRKRTIVTLQMPATPTPMASPATAAETTASAPASPPNLVDRKAASFAGIAAQPPSITPRNAKDLVRATSQLFSPGSDAALRLIAGSNPALQRAVFTALATDQLAPAASLQAYSFRASTAPFGNRAPPPVVTDGSGRPLAGQEWTIAGPTFGPELLFSTELAAQNNGARPIASFLREIAGAVSRNAAFSDNVGFIATVTFDAVTLRLKLDAGNRFTATGTLSESIGEVTVALSNFSAKPLALEAIYSFKTQPLTIHVKLTDGAEPTAVNDAKTDAAVNLEVDKGAADLLRVLGSLRPVTGTQDSEMANVLNLDGVFDSITPGGWVVFDTPQGATPAPLTVQSAATISRTAYGQTTRCSRLTLDGSWIDPDKADFRTAIRETAVYADSQALSLVAEDVTEPLAQVSALELDGLVTGLQSGRWLVVSGERTDLPGVTSAELVMLAGADHGGETLTAAGGKGQAVAPAETPHTTLNLVSPIAYSYQRATVQIFGNVAPASMGDSSDEILGSGNGNSANQAFSLKKKPLTFTQAATALGGASTLTIRVNNIAWTETDTLATAAPGDKVYVTAAADDGTITVTFGDGVNGARLPTGTENIRASYRAGIGEAGNLDPGTITSLLSRPLGVKSVTNPIAASGGIDPETTDGARANIPIGLISLARLVSVDDYQDLALAFAGKASASLFSGADGPLVQLSLATLTATPFTPGQSDWRVLAEALRDNGDPGLEVETVSGMVRLALIQASVAVDADREWSDVEPVIRAAMLDAFGFTSRDFGQPLYASEVIGVIQNVAGVAYVDLQTLSAVPQPATLDALHSAVLAGGVRDVPASIARVDSAFIGRPRQLLPAELVYLSPDLADMLILNEAAL